MTNIEQVSAQFAFQGVYAGCEELKSGNINSTYHVTNEYPHREYILQRINHHVFKKPREVMNLLDKYITEQRDRYSIRGRDLIGMPHEGHVPDFDDPDLDT